MSRSVLLAGALCIPVFYVLMKGDLVVILMSVVAGYVIHTLSATHVFYGQPSGQSLQRVL